MISGIINDSAGNYSRFAMFFQEYILQLTHTLFIFIPLFYKHPDFIMLFLTAPRSSHHNFILNTSNPNNLSTIYLLNYLSIKTAVKV